MPGRDRPCKEDPRPGGARDEMQAEIAGGAVRAAQLQVPGQGVKVQGGGQDCQCELTIVEK